MTQPHPERIDELIAAKRSAGPERLRAKARERRLNRSIILLAVALTAVLVLALFNAGRVIGVTDAGLEASVGSEVSGEASCAARAGARWRCTVERQAGSSESSRVEVWQVQETSRGCWQAVPGSRLRANPKAAPTRADCLGTTDYVRAAFGIRGGGIAD